jgi:hypothetical protein
MNHSVVTYSFSNRLLSVTHWDSRYEASVEFDRMTVNAGTYVELRDRFGCLARRDV